MNAILLIAGSVLSAIAAPAPSATSRFPEAREAHRPGVRLAQARRTCGSVSSCREAVILWCGGYSRADGDNDGIPRENVCATVEEVDEIREEIGC